MAYDLANLSISDILQIGAVLETLGEDAASMEEAAGRIVDYLYANLQVQPSEEPACALVRLYCTLPFGELSIPLRGFARAMASEQALTDVTICLTLLATRGEEPAWNSRKRSVQHQAIPLLSEEMVQQMPMVAQLIHQLGMEVSEVLHPKPDLLIDPNKHTHNVFWVPQAKGSAHIPAQQEFVIPYGIRSVIGFGGLLPGGSLYAVILFTKVALPAAQARRFGSLAVSVRVTLSQSMRHLIFAAG